jgi:hypothetical protein
MSHDSMTSSLAAILAIVGDWIESVLNLSNLI